MPSIMVLFQTDISFALAFERSDISTNTCCACAKIDAGLGVVRQRDVVEAEDTVLEPDPNAGSVSHEQFSLVYKPKH